jgi:hypothetical protein
MGRSIAAVYTPDDDLEHAFQLIHPVQGQNSGYPIRDVTFSPATQGHVGPGLSNTPLNTIWAVGGTFCPIDNMRYIFFATSDNKIFWTRFSSNYKNPPKDNLIYPGTPWREVAEFTGYSATAIVDLAAYFTGSQIEVVALMNNGDLWRMGGTPWSWNTWSQIPIWANFKGCKRIALFEGAGWGHIMLASDHDITEVYYTWNKSGQDKIWSSDKVISDLGAFFSEEDGTAHIIAAIPVGNGTEIHEITFVPAMVPPSSRILATVPFMVESLGAYEKPDKGRHVIMQAPPPYQGKEILYLSWYAPGEEGFGFGLWPPQTPW